MNFSRFIILSNLVAVTCVWAIWEYRISSNNPGPDVIVGDIYGVSRYPSTGSLNGQAAFSIGTVSCNIGTAQLAWISNTNQHPVISQNLYRVKNGRIEMIGMSWLKHGFTALQQSLCSSCQSSGSGSWLGVGCSDPYSSSLNGSQSGLGPRSQVNALTGFFPWPKGNLPSNPNALDGRIRVFNDDLNPALNVGARYFAESMYVAADDAAAGNGLNNASYREIFVGTVSGGWTVAFGSPQTVRMQPVMYAWKAVHPDVRIFTVDVPGEGRIFVGMRTTPLAGGGFHTEFAVENLNSHQSVRSLGVNYGSNVIANPGFKDIDYQHEPYSGTDWTPNIVGSEIEWSTQTFAANPNANAIRWNTLYSFWCDSELPPRSLTLGMFRPGTVAEMNIDLIAPVVPESFTLRQGQVVDGLFANVFLSDDQYFELGTGLTHRAPKIVLELDAVSPTGSPVDFAFRLEAAMLNPPIGDVIQMVELLNHDTGQFEVVDARPTQTTDQRQEITPTGDWSRFIHNKTNVIQARLEWKYIGPARDRFGWTIAIDEAVWLIAE